MGREAAVGDGSEEPGAEDAAETVAVTDEPAGELAAEPLEPVESGDSHVPISPSGSRPRNPESDDDLPDNNVEFVSDSTDGEYDVTDSESEEDELLLRKGRYAPPVRKRTVVIGGKVVELPPNITVTRLAPSEEARKKDEEERRRRREAHLASIRREGPIKGICSSKRKNDARMTLQEAKATDFNETKDYVDFIQAKLEKIQIKIVQKPV